LSSKDAKDLVRIIKDRFPTSRGSLFNFRDEVEIIQLKDLEFALNRLIEEGIIIVKEK